MREEGAGVVETAIAMSLVGVLVMVSVASLGGGIRSFTTSHVVPVVGGGAHPDGGDGVQGESSSSTPSDQPPLLDEVGPISLNESDYQSSSSTDWDWSSELSLGSWCTSQDGTSYFSTQPCPDLISDWDSSRVAGGVAPPVISWCQDENGNSYMQENAPCPY